MYNTAGSPPPYSFSYVEFYDYEVMEISIPSRDYSLIKELGTGKPKLINRSGFNRIIISFNLQSTNAAATSTLAKLKTLRDNSSDVYVVYYKRLANADAYRICHLDRKQIPDDITLAGKYAGRQNLTVEFLEYDKTSELFGEDFAVTLFSSNQSRLAFRYNENWVKLAYDSALPTSILLAYDGGGTSNDIYFTIDYDRNYFYCQDYVSSTWYLQRRSLVNGDLQASYTLAAQQKLIGVDSDGYLWTIKNSADKYVYRWNRNLAECVTFTLKAANALGDLINYAAFTWDGAYIYLTGGADNDIVSKYDIDNLNGGDPEWSVDIGSDNANHICVDENDDVYVGDIPTGGANSEIRKLSDTDGSVTWGPVDGAKAGCIFAYCEENAMLYTPYDANLYRKIDASDGATIATTAAVATNTYCCAIAAGGDYVFGGTASTADGGVRAYNLALTYQAIFQVLATVKYQFAGDPTGYLFLKMKTYKP